MKELHPVNTSVFYNGCDEHEDIVQVINSWLSATNEQKLCNEEEIPDGVTDTMSTATDFLGDSERQYVLNVAPGEGYRPLSVFRNKYSEELASSCRYISGSGKT